MLRRAGAWGSLRRLRNIIGGELFVTVKCALYVAYCLLLVILAKQKRRQRTYNPLLSVGHGVEKMAQELARHKNIDITQRYAHLADDDLDRGYHEIFNE